MPNKPMELKQVTLFELMAETEKQSFSQAIVQANPDQKPEPPNPTAQMAAQLLKVYVVMRQGRWMTLAEIAYHAKTPEASASARLRDLRKKGFVISKRKAPDGKLYVYQLSGQLPS